MYLTHVCPDCKKEHEMNCTPEPDQRCPECESKHPEIKENGEEIPEICHGTIPTDDECRLNNIVKIEFWVNCGNCTMNAEERAWYIDKINELCEMRESKLKDIIVYN